MSAKATLKLYELPAALRKIDALLDESDGEITPEIGELLNEYDAALPDLVNAVCHLIREAEAAAGACKAVAEPILARAKSHEARAERLKEYLRVTLEQLGESKIKTDMVSVSVCSAQPSIQVAGPLAALPEQFLRVKYEADKSALAEWIRGGNEPPPGVSTVTTRYLRIR